MAASTFSRFLSKANIACCDMGTMPDSDILRCLFGFIDRNSFLEARDKPEAIIPCSAAPIDAAALQAYGGHSQLSINFWPFPDSGLNQGSGRDIAFGPGIYVGGSKRVNSPIDSHKAGRLPAVREQYIRVWHIRSPIYILGYDFRRLFCDKIFCIRIQTEIKPGCPEMGSLPDSSLPLCDMLLTKNYRADSWQRLSSL
jgi:hypothetical protein